MSLTAITGPQDDDTEIPQPPPPPAIEPHNKIYGLVVATYSVDDWGPPMIFELEARWQRVRCIARTEEIPGECVRPSHYLPWFLLDALSEAHPERVLFVQEGFELTPELIKAALEAYGSDIALTYKDRQPTSEAICLTNADITRELLDGWIKLNDRKMNREADVNLREIIRRYNVRAQISTLPRRVLRQRVSASEGESVKSGSA